MFLNDLNTFFSHPRPSSTYEMDKLATKEEESPVTINYF